MEDRQLKLLQQTLDDIRHQNGVEYWFARELFPILGYTRWDGFEPAIQRAKDSCLASNGNVADHFREVTKMVALGSGAAKAVLDIKLDRYACYLIALNGDPKKEEVAFAQAYFVSRTRTFEVLTQKMQEMARIDARDKLKITEKDFSNLAFSRGVDSPGIARVRSAGDKALFGGHTTEEMKARIGVPNKKPLADYLPDVTLKAKDLATAMTIENVRRENIQGETHIKHRHVASNHNVRGALINTGIIPESLPAGEDIKKIESRHRKELKALQDRHREELKHLTKN
ncbi:MAG: DNA damage-inducible protein D [Patescibacteria group bacterium]